MASSFQSVVGTCRLYHVTILLLVTCLVVSVVLRVDPFKIHSTSVVRPPLRTADGVQGTTGRAVAMEVLQDEVTIVTAYLNIGSFKKGGGDKWFTPALYRQWIKVFHRIQNPVVAFFDDERDVKMFNVVRNMLPENRTRVVKVNRSSLSSFSRRDKIRDIFAQSFYPKYSPNTVVPDYSCAMHAKYELMARVVRENPFNTTYFCWLDVGLFRGISADRGPPFSLDIPPGFNKSKVAYSQVRPLIRSVRTAKQIVQGNLVWVCGCFFIATRDVMARWTKQYMVFMERMLATGWISTDQQVLYYMTLPAHNNISRHGVSIQAYSQNTKYNTWFKLGYLCKDEGEKRKQ